MRAIIVDDEITSSQVLEELIKHYLPQLHIIAVCNKPLDAVSKLATMNPDLVFMDIELPGMSGFDILEKIKNINFEVIFTTAHIQYGIKAIQFSAIDYLLKPIIPDDLVAALDKSAEILNVTDETLKFDNLLDNFSQLTRDLKKIVVAFTCAKAPLKKDMPYFYVILK